VAFPKHSPDFCLRGADIGQPACYTSRQAVTVLDNSY
jgi:hypothetical protein